MSDRTITFDQWLDNELQRLDRLGNFIDQEITTNKLKPISGNYLRTFKGSIRIVEILCGQIYGVTETGRPLGLIKLDSSACLELKETDLLDAKLGWRDDYWHFLKLTAIRYAGPDEDLANLRKKREKFLNDYPFLRDFHNKKGEP